MRKLVFKRESDHTKSDKNSSINIVLGTRRTLYKNAGRVLPGRSRVQRNAAGLGGCWQWKGREWLAEGLCALLSMML